MFGSYTHKESYTVRDKIYDPTLVSVFRDGDTSSINLPLFLVLSVIWLYINFIYI